MNNPPSLSTPIAPVWEDGLPQNLPAAAIDALEWLEWLRRAEIVGALEAPRLRGCIESLGEFLPETEEAEAEAGA